MRRNIIITAVFFIGMVLLGVFVFGSSYLRVWESICDLGSSARYYFCELFGVEHSFTATVKEYSGVFSWGTVLPEDFGEFKENAAAYFSLLFDAENFAGWGEVCNGSDRRCGKDHHDSFASLQKETFCRV